MAWFDSILIQKSIVSSLNLSPPFPPTNTRPQLHISPASFFVCFFSPLSDCVISFFVRQRSADNVWGWGGGMVAGVGTDHSAEGVSVGTERRKAYWVFSALTDHICWTAFSESTVRR